MNKASLAQALAEKLNLTKKEAEEIVNSTIEIMIATLKKGEEVILTGFGAFSVRQRASRAGVNPQNPSQKIMIPAVKVPKFKAGKALKDALKSQ